MTHESEQEREMWDDIAAGDATRAAEQTVGTGTGTGPALVVSPWRHPRTGQTRYYVQNAEEVLGLDVTRYGTGNISLASLVGERIANGRAARIMQDMSKLYITVESGRAVVHTKQIYGNGLVGPAQVVDAVRAAYAVGMVSPSGHPV